MDSKDILLLRIVAAIALVLIVGILSSYIDNIFKGFHKKNESNYKDYCYKGGSRHSFASRYDVKTRDDMPRADEVLNNTCLYKTPGDVMNMSENLKHQYTNKAYRGDVCEWCGKVVNSQDKETNPKPPVKPIPPQDRLVKEGEIKKKSNS